MTHLFDTIKYLLFKIIYNFETELLLNTNKKISCLAAFKEHGYYFTETGWSEFLQHRKHCKLEQIVNHISFFIHMLVHVYTTIYLSNVLGDLLTLKDVA